MVSAEGKEGKSDFAPPVKGGNFSKTRFAKGSNLVTFSKIFGSTSSKKACKPRDISSTGT